MFYAKVIGKTYSNFKHSALEAIPIKIIHKIDIETKEVISNPILALDPLGVAIGEFVGFEVSSEATWVFEDKLVPTDTTIIAIIDSINLEKGN